VPRRIVKTPNGKYAAFSDRVDLFVAFNMTREEAVKFCIEEWDLGPKTSEEKVLRADEDITEDGEIGRYEEAIETIRLMYGAEQEEKYRKLLEA
jgi:1,4-dihydroxy-2-naphthoyl-CoA synthase